MGIAEELSNLFPKVDSENPPEKLDKVEKSLNSLKEQIQGKKVDDVETPLHDAFKVDCKEADIGDADEEKYWQEIDQTVKTEVLKGTLEFAQLENLVNNNKNLEGLRNALASKDPLAKVKKKIAYIAAIPILGPMVLGFAHDTLYKWAQDKEGKDRPGAKELRAFADLMAPAKGPEKPKTPQELAANKEKEEKGRLDGIKKKIADAGLALEDSNLTQDIADLAALGIKDEGDKKDLSKLIDDALASGSNFMKLRLAIKDHEGSLPADKFKFRLSDLRLNNLNVSNIDLVVKGFTGKKEEAKFKLANPNDLAEIRKYVDLAKTTDNIHLESVMAAQFPLEGKATAVASAKPSDKKEAKNG